MSRYRCLQIDLFCLFIVNGEICNLYYGKETCGYVFYVLVDWQLSEQGVPVNSLEGEILIYTDGNEQRGGHAFHYG